MTLLAVLSSQEKKQFDLPPKFGKDERAVYFSLTPPMRRYLSRMDNNHSRAGFLLQLAYFRANAKFYTIEKFFKRDIQHVQALLRCKEVNLSQYNSTIISKHRKKILALLDWSILDCNL